MNSRRRMCPLRTRLDQGLKPSTLQPGGEWQSGPMSALGHKRTFAVQKRSKGMSALGQKQTCHYVRVCRNGKARFGVMWLALELKLFAMTCPITQTTSWTLCKVTA